MTPPPAPVKPAEFVIFRIGQMAGQGDVAGAQALRPGQVVRVPGYGA